MMGYFTQNCDEGLCDRLTMSLLVGSPTLTTADAYVIHTEVLGTGNLFDMDDQ